MNRDRETLLGMALIVIGAVALIAVLAWLPSREEIRNDILRIQSNGGVK